MFAKSMSVAALLAALGASGAVAQGRSGPIIPAEMPPSSFAGTQYVDSRGCVFIRAGMNGRVNWVPRYGDDRRQMCGSAPSLASAPAAAPVQAAPRVATAAPSAPAPTYRAAPVPPQAPVVRTGATRIPFSVPPEPSRPQARATAPAQPSAHVHHVSGPQGLDRRWSHYDRTGPSPCAHYSPHSQLYGVPGPSRPDLPLRCGPQAEHPSDATNRLAPRGGVWEPWDGVNPSPMAPNVYQLPPAYAPRWPDAHLRDAAPAQPQRSASASPHARLSTSGTADPGPSVAPVAAGRYVQVGTFGVTSNAQSTISRLQAHGLPVARGQVRQGGRALDVVMAGPFSNPSDANAALNAARAMGFRDAFLR